MVRRMPQDDERPANACTCLLCLLDGHPLLVVVVANVMVKCLENSGSFLPVKLN
jgi:hypothetical protein